MATLSLPSAGRGCDLQPEEATPARLSLTWAQHLEGFTATPQGPTPPTTTVHHPLEDRAHPASNFKPWVWGSRGRSNQFPVETPCRVEAAHMYVHCPASHSHLRVCLGTSGLGGTQRTGLVSQTEKLKLRKGKEPAEVTQHISSKTEPGPQTHSCYPRLSH